MRGNLLRVAGGLIDWADARKPVSTYRVSKSFSLAPSKAALAFTRRNKSSGRSNVVLMNASLYQGIFTSSLPARGRQFNPQLRLIRLLDFSVSACQFFNI
jgi:hypothetical protein